MIGIESHPALPVKNLFNLYAFRLHKHLKKPVDRKERTSVNSMDKIKWGEYMKLLSSVSFLVFLGALSHPCGAIKDETGDPRGTAKIRKITEEMTVHGTKQVGITFGEDTAAQNQGTTLRIRREDLATLSLDRMTDLRIVGDGIKWEPTFAFKKDIDETDLEPLSFGTLKSLETILTTPKALKRVIDKARGQTHLYLEVRHMVTPKTLKQWKPITDISSLHRLGLKVESVKIAMALLERWQPGLQKRQQENAEANQPPPPLKLILFIDEYVNALRQETQHADTFKAFDALVGNFGSHLHVYSQNDIAPGYGGPEKLFVDGNSHTPALFGVGTEGAGMRTPLGGISVSAFPRVLHLLVNPIDPAAVKRSTVALFDNECRLHDISQSLPSDFDETERLFQNYPTFSTMTEKDRLEAQLLLFDQPEEEHRALLQRASDFLNNNPLQDIDMIVDHTSLPLRTLKVFTAIEPSQWDSIVGQAGRLFTAKVTVAHRLQLVAELSKWSNDAERTLLVNDVLDTFEDGMAMGFWNYVKFFFGSQLTPHAFEKLTPSGYGRFLLDTCELMSLLPKESRKEKAPALLFRLFTYHKRDAGVFGRLTRQKLLEWVVMTEFPNISPRL